MIATNDRRMQILEILIVRKSETMNRLAEELGVSRIGGVEITIFFAEEEPARNAKEACLSIIGRQYESRAVAGE